MRLTVKITLFTLAPAAALLFAVWMLHAEQHSSQTVLASTGARFDLTAANRCVSLKQQTAGSLKKQLDAVPADRSLYLVIAGLQAPKPPGVLYAVHLEPGGTQAPSESSRVGYLNFFSAGAGSKGKPFSFDVTQLMRTLIHEKPDLSSLQVCLVPGGTPESTPSVESIQLLAY